MAGIKCRLLVESGVGERKTMSTKNERLQSAWHSYEKKQDHLPTSARQAVEWAVAEGILALPEIDPYDVLAGEMAQAL